MKDWAKPVEGAPLPSGDTVGDWVQFSDAQTGRLDVANERIVASVGTIARCEARDAQSVKKARGGFLSRLF